MGSSDTLLERYIQKFTPRQSGSHWAASNVRRVKKMIAHGSMTEAGLKLFNEIKTGKAKRVPVRTEIPSPPDLRTALALNKKASENFNRFAPSHRKMYIWWITDATTPDTRQRRIARVVEFAAQNKKPGMM